jgi:hypothetical protein
MKDPTKSLAEIEAALTPDPMTVREIWLRLGRWSPPTVRKQCDKLVRLGRAATDTIPVPRVPSGFARTYSKVDA